MSTNEQMINTKKNLSSIDLMKIHNALFAEEMES